MTGRGKFVAAWRLACVLAVALPGLAMAQTPAAPPQEDNRPLSQAQIILFETQHLKAITKPQKLYYDFTRVSPAGDGFTDRIKIDIREVKPDGAKSIFADFLTGEHHVDYQAKVDFRGNPVLIWYLERDVKQLEGVTGGKAQYFRNRFREAMVDRAVVTPVSIKFGGKTVSATEITVAPYKDLPPEKGGDRLKSLPEIAAKTYRFVVSDAVPGQIYQIATVTGLEGAGSKQLTETATFAGEQ